MFKNKVKEYVIRNSCNSFRQYKFLKQEVRILIFFTSI